MKKERTKGQKIWTIIEIVIGSLLLATFVTCIILEGVIPDSDFTAWMRTNVWDIEKTGAVLRTHVPTLINCIIWFIIIFAICKIIRIIFRGYMEKSKRAKTVITLLDGFVKYGCGLALIIIFLKGCGVNTTALIASVGILTLVIGLGAQSLIADIIAGMFIVFENEYNVGEIVAIDDFRGEVVEIGIRSTKLLDTAGNIKIINNSDIKSVVNMSRELSLAIIDCEYPYDVPQEVVERVLMQNLDNIKAKIPAITDGPYYKGVSQYEDSNVACRLVAQCKEVDRFQVQRDLLREYRMLFVKNGFDLSFQQVVINNPKPFEQTLTEKEKQEVEEFVDDQKEASKELDAQEGE